jgi:S-adenosylmethionine:tRNA ribosyltransferase-isomerase
LNLQDFYYSLPKELIAPYPVPKRSEARLLVLDRKTGRMEHRTFKDVADYLRPGDLLVLNNTKVLPARLFGTKPTGGKVEVLLLKQAEETLWEILVKPSGRVKKGTQLVFGQNGVPLEGEIVDEPSGTSGIRRIRFESGDLKEKLAAIGRIPLPPYIDRPDEEIDRQLYQTIFAQVEGAVASPTAGLHFDEALLEALRQKGIETCFVTLHVSYGTFQPVHTEDLSKHEMYEEEFEVTEEAANQIQRALKEKRRIIASGTTVVRVLETMGRKIRPVKGRTRLFIYPPYQFKGVDLLITNFHLSRSTLLMLVGAFTGRDLLFRAYEEAIRERYRFYSYGDAMLIL